MNYRVFLFSMFISIIIASCSVPVKPTENEQGLINSIHEILEVKAQLAEKYWSEFNMEEYTAPIIFFADAACYVLNPKRRFIDEFECDKLAIEDLSLYKTKTYETEVLDSLSFHMETHVELLDDTTCYGRTPYVKCSTLEAVQEKEPTIQDNSWWVPVVMHEMVHGCQDSHPNHYIARGSV